MSRSSTEGLECTRLCNGCACDLKITFAVEKEVSVHYFLPSYSMNSPIKSLRNLVEGPSGARSKSRIIVDGIGKERSIARGKIYVLIAQSSLVKYNE